VFKHTVKSFLENNIQHLEMDSLWREPARCWANSLLTYVHGSWRHSEFNPVLTEIKSSSPRHPAPSGRYSAPVLLVSAYHCSL